MPEPTSPCTSLFMVEGPDMSFTPSVTARCWAPVSLKGRSLVKSSGKPPGIGCRFSCLEPLFISISPSCKTRNSSKTSLRLAISRSSIVFGKCTFSRA